MQSSFLFSWILLVMMLLEATRVSLGNFKCIWNRTTEYIFILFFVKLSITKPFLYQLFQWARVLTSEAPGCLKNICLIISIIFPFRELSLIDFAMSLLLASFHMSQGNDFRKARVLFCLGLQTVFCSRCICW